MTVKYEYIPLDERIAFNRQRAEKRRRWLEQRHARNPRCDYCGNITELKPREYNQVMNHNNEFVATLDHRVPIGRGGTDYFTNWRLACAICNNLKADMPEEDFIAMLKAEGVR